MLPWKKRDEGFEWHKYVRTTIKLRREARREKAEKLGRQAAEGAKAAGVAAGAAAEALARKSAEGARAAGEAAQAAAKMSAAGVGVAAQGAARAGGKLAASGLGFVGLALGALWQGLGRLLSPLLDVLGRPAVGGPLILAGTIAAVAGAGRALFAPGGLDGDARTALAIGATCLVLGLGPAAWLGHSALPRLLSAPLAGLAPRWRIVAGVTGIAAIAGAALLVAAPTRFSLPSLASLPFPAIGGGRTITGKARMLAADRIAIGETTVRLAGIEAPDPDQRCQKASASARSKGFACGADARDALRRLLGGDAVSCDITGPDASGIATGTCRSGDTDLAEHLVKSGHAFAETGMVSRYRAVEAAAQAAKAGVWASGEPERPAQWRDRLWQAARSKAPDGCPIKGRVRRGERSYVLPWSSDYDRVTLRTSRGERWFCSEADAVAAGWQRAG